jgi:hypothetical protein
MKMLYKLICIKPDGSEKLVKGGLEEDRANKLKGRFSCMISNSRDSYKVVPDMESTKKTRE